MGSVDVPISHVSARLADVSPHGKQLSDNPAAPEAPLRCKTRRYLDDSRPSILGFEREYVDESRPTRIGDGAGEMAVFEHVLDPQVFNSDEGVGVNVVTSRLVRVILTLAGDLEVLLGRFAAAVGTLLPSCALSLRPPQSLGGSLQTAWVLDDLPFGIGEEVSKAQVEPNSRPVAFLRCVPKIADDKDVPMSVSAIDQMSGLRSTFKWTVLFNLQAPSVLLRDSQPSRISVEVYVSPRAVLSKLNRMPAVGCLEARETHILAKLATAEKTLEGSIKTAGERLHRALRDMLAATSLDTVRQIVAAEKRARSLVMSLDRFEHLVVKTAALGQTGAEPSVLGAVEEKPVLERLVHLLVVLDIGISRNGSSAGRPKATTLKPGFL